MKQQQDLLAALQGQGGVQNQSQVYNQMQQVAAGQGPNPAQAQLAQATGQNVANQAALMAGQRGASSNAGLTARQAAQQGANTQQQAAGQGATLQAQQSLNAIGQSGQMANTMAAQQQQQTNQNTNSQQAMNQNLMNAQQGKNAAAVATQTSVNAGNAAMNLQQQQQSANLAGNMAGAAGSALVALSGTTPQTSAQKQEASNAAFASDFDKRQASGFAPQAQTPPPMAPTSEMAEGGPVGQPQAMAQAPQQQVTPNPPLPSMAMLMSAEANAPAMDIMSSQAGQQPIASGAPKYGNVVGHMMAKGGSVQRFALGGPVPALVSPGEKYLPPQAVEKVKQGANPLAMGQTIPGKPKVSGSKNSYANDTVPATLEEGGIVLPRSVTQSKNPQWAAHKFVSAILAKQGKGMK